MLDDLGVEIEPNRDVPSEVDGRGGIDPAIPLMALSILLVAVGIPFLAVAGSMGLGGAVLGIAGVVVVLVVATSLTKSVLGYRHVQRMKELRLQLELTRQENAKLAEVNRVVGLPPLDL